MFGQNFKMGVAPPNNMQAMRPAVGMAPPQRPAPSNMQPMRPAVGMAPPQRPMNQPPTRQQMMVSAMRQGVQ